LNTNTSDVRGAFTYQVGASIAGCRNVIKKLMAKEAIPEPGPEWRQNRPDDRE
jgi:hypothetical protein